MKKPKLLWLWSMGAAALLVGLAVGLVLDKDTALVLELLIGTAAAVGLAVVVLRPRRG